MTPPGTGDDLGPPESVATSLGIVEVARSYTDGPPVLFFPGGHCRATTPAGADLYAELGYQVVSFSRPGYGRTEVRDHPASQFVRAVEECCDRLSVGPAHAIVGVSFGGLQAIQVAGTTSLGARLVLHSCAPSTFPYPDRLAERLAAPFVFGRRSGRATWAVVRRLVETDRGLRLMVQSLSTLPVRDWWQSWDAHDREAARTTFQMMDSGRGFVLDLSQAREEDSDARRAAQFAVTIPTLITASRHDAGVSFRHSLDFAATIPDARLVEIAAPSHLFWLGPTRDDVLSAISSFLP